MKDFIEKECGSPFDLTSSLRSGLNLMKKSKVFKRFFAIKYLYITSWLGFLYRNFQEVNSDDILILVDIHIMNVKFIYRGKFSREFILKNILIEKYEKPYRFHVCQKCFE